MREEPLGEQAAALERLECEAQRAKHFALLGRLAAGMSHELRNPLATLFLHVELLEEELHHPLPDSPSQIAQTLAEHRNVQPREQQERALLDRLGHDHLRILASLVVPGSLVTGMPTAFTMAHPRADVSAGSSAITRG